MTLYQIISEAQEKTHLGELEILEIIREQWPRVTEFSGTQAALLVRLIERRKEKL